MRETEPTQPRFSQHTTDAVAATRANEWSRLPGPDVVPTARPLTRGQAVMQFWVSAAAVCSQVIGDRDLALASLSITARVDCRLNSHVEAQDCPAQPPPRRPRRNA